MMNRKYLFSRGFLYFKDQSGKEYRSIELSMPHFPENILNNDRMFIKKALSNFSDTQISKLQVTSYGLPKIFRKELSEPFFESNITIKEWFELGLLFSADKEKLYKDVNNFTKNVVFEDKHITWKPILEKLFVLPEVKKYLEFVKEERKSKNIFPSEKEMFNAFKFTQFNAVNVVIVGQDPYPTAGHAHGLSFSCLKGIPASLKNIYTEITFELYNTKNFSDYFADGNLIPWAEQGVLLLNTVLSVEEGKPESHVKKGCEVLTSNIIKKLSEERKNIVFMLWGSKAQSFIPLIDTKKHLVLKSGHPSPMSANKGLWFDNKHFVLANDYFIKNEKPIIKWTGEKIERKSLTIETDDF